MKFVPDTFTVAPLVRLTEGLAVSAGGLTIDAFGVTLLEGSELVLAPTLFLATTVNV